MKFKSFFISVFIYTLLFTSCGRDDNNSDLYLAKDFSKPGEFTSGIEGPASDNRGNTFVVNFGKEGTIGVVDSKGFSRLFVQLPEGSTGNGIRISKSGELLVADYTGHNILSVDTSSLNISVYAHSDQMNQPNDLAIMDNGILFASDPNWSASTGNMWRIDKDGMVVQLEENMGTTNGIEVSPDQKTLYVNESVQRNVWSYEINNKGDISNKQLFHSFPDFGMDGMRCDVKGNLYITRHGKGTIAILSPEGDLLKEIALKGSKPSNISFGGPDGKTCYVTLQDRGCLEMFRSEFQGRAWRG